MSIAPLVFQGISKFSADFQTIVDRAVSIAQLPMKALQNHQADLVTEKLAASNLSTAVADLAAAVGVLGGISSNALSATSTNSSKVMATATGGGQNASYRITGITSVASAASETSLRSYGASDTVSSTGRLTLAVGAKTYTIDVSGDNTLKGVAKAINAVTGAGVSATVITTTNGSYLSLSATKTGKNAISLSESKSISEPLSIAAGVNDQLTITTDAGTETLTLAGSDATLDDVVQDINTNSAYATASISVDGSGNRRLVISPKGAGAATVSGTAADQLGLGGASLLTSANPGTNAEFKLNGISVSKSDNVISDLVDGTTFTINGTTASGETVGITVGTNRSAISSALQNLVAKYNAVADQVNAQIGPNAGLLSGNSIIRDVRGAMLALTSYSGGSGQVKGLAALGIEMDRSGKMSLNSDTFDALSDGQISDAFSFFGSATTGFGALQKQFSQISDPVTGTIKAQLDSFAAADKRINQQVADMTDRINLMQTSLRAKLQAADSLLASLESQQNMLTSSVQSLNYTSYGKDPGSN